VIIVRCLKCNSPRIIKFLDGFGKDRLFCKECQESILIDDVMVAQKNMMQFIQPNIVRGWKYDGDRKIGSLSNPR